MKHELIEKNVMLLAALTAVAISFGGLVEIIPLMNDKTATTPAPGLHMRTPLEVAGRDVYVREGCYLCHSQMIRPMRDEIERYGHYSLSAESQYDHPFQWGSKRTGPDLARIGGRYSDEWHKIHLNNPRDVVPESNMPGYPWLAKQQFEPGEVPAMMRALKRVGVPFDDAEIAKADDEVAGKSKMDALIAFLQTLKAPQPAPAVAGGGPAKTESTP